MNIEIWQLRCQVCKLNCYLAVERRLHEPFHCSITSVCIGQPFLNWKIILHFTKFLLPLTLPNIKYLFLLYHLWGSSLNCIVNFPRRMSAKSYFTKIIVFFVPWRHFWRHWRQFSRFALRLVNFIANHNLTFKGKYLRSILQSVISERCRTTSRGFNKRKFQFLEHFNHFLLC